MNSLLLRTLRTTLTALCLAAPFAPLAPLHAATAPLLAEAFARLPQAESVMLSPDGHWFAAIVRRGDDTIATVRPLDGSQPARAVLTNDSRESRLRWLHWVNNERLVVSLEYAGRRGGVATTETRLMAVGRDGGKPLALVEPSGQGFGSTTQLQDHVVDWMPDDGHHILLQATVDWTDTSPAVVRVNVDTAERETVQGRRFGVRRWIADSQHRVRVGVRHLEDQVEVLVNDPDGNNWRTAWSYKLGDPAAVEPLAFGSDPQVLVVAAQQGRYRALFEVALNDPALPRKPLLQLDGRDATTRLLQSPLNGRVLGSIDGHIGATASSYWDADIHTLMQQVDSALPGRNNRLQQVSADGQHYLVLSQGNGVPGQYFVGDRQQRRLDSLARQYPDLPSALLQAKEELPLTLRDGWKTAALLTRPAGGTRLPTVVMPRGEPLGNATLYFDPLPAFLADRGYAVLQVGFRGSAGHDGAGVRAHVQQHGIHLDDDLADALEQLVQQGIADPARVCVIGSGYGGYAALLAAARGGDRYRCVASVGGLGDLQAHANDSDYYVNGRTRFELLTGLDWSASRQQREASPTRMAAQFRTPVLLLHGTADREFPSSQSVALEAALKSAGKPVQLVLLPGGDHGLTAASLRVQTFRALEDFLALHLLQPAVDRR